MTTRKNNAFFKKLGIKFIALALILLGLTAVIDLSLRPIIETVNAYECHAAVSGIINDAINAELMREDINYSKLVNLTTNAEGEVVSIESNVININLIKNNIAQRIERELERMEAVSIEIPIGTLTGIQMLHGRGFSVGMTVRPLGYAETTIISEFTEAGINQTRHRIIVEIDADVDAVIPGFSTNVSIATSIVAAETVIMGRVPDAYTHVLSSEEGLAGTLEDYKAG